jgi:hypothetical protein
VLFDFRVVVFLRASPDLRAFVPPDLEPTLELEEEDADAFDRADLAAGCFCFEGESDFADVAAGDDLRFEVLWSPGATLDGSSSELAC